MDNITEIDIPLYFDLTHEIVDSFSDKHIDIIKICEKCRSRILQEIKKPSKMTYEDDGNTIVIKCFNLIKLICEKEINLAGNVAKLEVIFEPIFEYMKNPSKIDFEEEILVIITSFIKVTKSIVPSAKRLFVNLDKYFIQSKMISEELYTLLCYFILHGIEFLSEDRNYLNFVKKIFSKN